MNIDYSVIIRTTGKAGAKYRALLNSIAALSPQPAEIIVVLPEGYALPEEQLGWETFHFSPKGMVTQRMAGIAKCKTRYALICDDDVTFGSDFVQKLHAPIAEGLCAFSAGPLYSFLPPKGANACLCTLMGSAMPTLFHRKDRYVSVLKSTGYSYNRHLKPTVKKYYETQSVAWTCFYADIQALRSLEFDRETWLDANGYSAFDDQTMFYKAWLMGLKTFVVSDAYYEHLDAKTSTRNNKPAVLYSSNFNCVVFWHRFIRSQQRNFLSKGLSRIALSYKVLWIRIANCVAVLKKRMTKEDYRLTRKGYRDGWQYVQSAAYASLPSFIKK